MTLRRAGGQHARVPTVRLSAIDCYYERDGEPGAPVVLLVAGLGMQCCDWDDRLVALLVGEGFEVVRYDNRDVGLSSHLTPAGVPDLTEVLVSGARAAPYLVEDMATDALDLLDALDVGAAHVIGVSMGGMIAQALAVRAPSRVQSLCSVMSTTGDPSVGRPRQEAAEALLRPAPRTAEEAERQAVETWRLIGSPAYPIDEALERAKARRAFLRAHDPDGVARQLAAVLASPDRTPALRSLEVPTFVVHGADDPLVDVSGGLATAAAVPGASLWVVPGMGHHLPEALYGELVARYVRFARGAEARR